MFISYISDGCVTVNMFNAFFPFLYEDNKCVVTRVALLQTAGKGHIEMRFKPAQIITRTGSVKSLVIPHVCFRDLSLQ